MCKIIVLARFHRKINYENTPPNIPMVKLKTICLYMYFINENIKVCSPMYIIRVNIIPHFQRSFIQYDVIYQTQYIAK